MAVASRLTTACWQLLTIIPNGPRLRPGRRLLMSSPTALGGITSITSITSITGRLRSVSIWQCPYALCGRSSCHDGNDPPGGDAGALGVVGGWRGGVRAAGRGGPAHDAGLGFLDVPPGGLLAAMMPAAERMQTALAGGAVGVGDDVVEVAVDGLPVAAGRGAGGGTGEDQVPELAAGGVAVLGMAVVAGAPGDGLGGGVEGAQELREPCRLGGAGAGLPAGLRAGAGGAVRGSRTGRALRSRPAMPP